MADGCDFDRVHDELDRAYGPRAWHSAGDPIGELVGTVLSQHTSDINTARAYRSLRDRFPTWEEVVAAPVGEVEDAIRCGGLAAVKAPRIQRILRSILEQRGALSLDGIEEMPTGEARDWLTSLPGVGPKTASCVLLFSLGRPALPVDTHVHRIALRLGLVPPKTSAEAAHGLLEAQVGEDRDRVYAFHMNAIAHGKAVCTARNPRCGICPLQDCCDHFRAHRDEPGHRDVDVARARS